MLEEHGWFGWFVYADLNDDVSSANYFTAFCPSSEENVIMTKIFLLPQCARVTKAVRWKGLVPALRNMVGLLLQSHIAANQQQSD